MPHKKGYTRGMSVCSRTMVVVAGLAWWSSCTTPAPVSNDPPAADAAVLLDAGTTGDASTPLDAAVASDAAELPDAATTVDAAVTPDAAPPMDAGVLSSDAATAQWRSTLYPVDWMPGHADDAGRALQDYSYAGYRYGETPVTPSGPTFSALDHGADPTGSADSTAAVQAAVDAASVNGGVVVLPAGTYRLDGVITVLASNVVLRGAGVGQTLLHFTSVGPSNVSHVAFGNGGGFGTEHVLTEDGQRFSTVVRVANATGLTVGMDVALGFIITPGFVADHGMTGVWQAFNGTWQPFYLRTITAVDTASTPHTVTLDVPLRDGMLTRDGASLRVHTGLLHEVGLEDVSISNAVTRAQAWSVTQVHAVGMDGVANGWVRNVHSYGATGGDHLQSGGILVKGSKRVTVANSIMAQAQHRGGGGNGYLFELRQSSEVLLVDNEARAGRHNFIQNWGFGTTGCVLLRCVSRDGRAFAADWDPIGLPGLSEFHHSLATANLMDGCTFDDGFNAGNRGTESTGAGHTAQENVFWNVRGSGVVRSLQYGHGYILGTQGLQVVTALSTVSFGFSGNGTAPEDHVEGLGLGQTLTPPSLYEDQRTRRLMP